MGHFCPAGQSEMFPSKYICPKGHYCKNGYALPRRCENGTYQNYKGQSSCKTCERGYSCDNTVNVADSLAGRECIIGHYCPAGTRYANEYGCLPGTWSNRTGLNTSSECDACPPK